jgi:hypothetical protein
MAELNGGIGLALATFDYSITNRVASTLGRITFTVAPGRQAGESVEVIVLASKLVDAQGVELPLQPGGSVATSNAASGAMSASPSVFMHPNPATNQVQLSWMHPVERIHVLDVQGRQVGSWQLSGTLSYSLSTMDWLPGMYLIVWEGHKQSGSTMLMVHH